MYKYHAYGLNIHSEIFLPELVDNESHPADLIIKYGEVDPFEGKTVREGVNFRETGYAKYRFWDEIGIFKISSGNQIIVQPAKDVEKVILRKFILGTVFANLLHQRGFLVLHASAVQIHNYAVAFLGSKNKGKSTTALEFYNKGHSIVADDYIPIKSENNNSIAYTGFPQLKLTEEHLNRCGFNFEDFEGSSKSEKYYYPAENLFKLTKLTLKNIYILERGLKNSISSLKNQEAFIELIRNNFGISRYKESDLKRSFLQCRDLIRNVTIKKLEIGSLPELTNLVLKDLSSDNKSDNSNGL